MRWSNAGRVFCRVVVVTAIAAGASACATTRGILDIRPAAVTVPASGPAVSLASIEDKRHFEIKPDDPSIPSLKDGRIDDASITSRAIARKRNTYGAALGDILLPEGRTVNAVIGEALTRALHQAGYRVLDSSAGLPQAADPLKVEILEMWSWFTPGFSTIDLECRIHVRVTGSRPPFAGGREFHGHSSVSAQFASAEIWKQAIDSGIESLADDIRHQFAEATVNQP